MRYFNRGIAYEGAEEHFPPELRPTVSQAAIIIGGEIPALSLKEERFPIPTFAILPNGLVITANEPTPEGKINQWPR